MNQHRNSYITRDDFKEMASHGIKQVRLPLGWWAFTLESSHSSTSKLITDPVHSDKMFVTITNEFLKNVIMNAKEEGVKVLIDIHAFPGGSASTLSYL